MGWSIGFDKGRDIGYGVPAICDHPGCKKPIDRGIYYVCGGAPYGGEHGCGLFFCDDHLQYAGKRRGYAQLCTCCYAGKGKSFDPKPDTDEWIIHKLTDESWSEWRKENQKWVSDHSK